MEISTTGEQDMIFPAGRLLLLNLLSVTIRSFVQNKDTSFLPISPTEIQVFLLQRQFLKCSPIP